MRGPGDPGLAHGRPTEPASTCASARGARRAGSYPAHSHGLPHRDQRSGGAPPQHHGKSQLLRRVPGHHAYDRRAAPLPPARLLLPVRGPARQGVLRPVAPAGHRADRPGRRRSHRPARQVPLRYGDVHTLVAAGIRSSRAAKHPTSAGRTGPVAGAPEPRPRSRHHHADRPHRELRLQKLLLASLTRREPRRFTRHL